jgi:hypothetical protein
MKTTEHERRIPAGGPPAELLTNWTIRRPWSLDRVAVVSIPPDDDPRPGARRRSNGIDWPAGGTEEFLGRCSARSNSRRAEAKGGPADPLNVFGAVDRLDGNRNDRTSRRRRGGDALVARSNLLQTATSQVGNSGVRALTLVSINGSINVGPLMGSSPLHPRLLRRRCREKLFDGFIHVCE